MTGKIKVYRLLAAAALRRPSSTRDLFYSDF